MALVSYNSLLNGRCLLLKLHEEVCLTLAPPTSAKLLPQGHANSFTTPFSFQRRGQIPLPVVTLAVLQLEGGLDHASSHSSAIPSSIRKAATTRGYQYPSHTFLLSTLRSDTTLPH